MAIGTEARESPYRGGGDLSPLAEVARRFRSGEATAEELSLVFVQSVLFCRGGVEPEFTAIGEIDKGFVPMYTSEVTLARAEGQCMWFTGTGRTLVGLIPPGYGVVVDRGTEGEVALASWAIHHPTVEVDVPGTHPIGKRPGGV